MNFLCSIPTNEKEIIKSLLKDCISMFNNYAIHNNLSSQQIRTIASDIYNAYDTQEHLLIHHVKSKLYKYYHNPKYLKFIIKELLGKNPVDTIDINEYKKYRHILSNFDESISEKVDYQTALIAYAIIRYNYNHRISFSRWKNIIAPPTIKSLNYNYYKDDVIYETDFCTYS